MVIHSNPEATLPFSTVEGSFAIVESIPAIAMDIEVTLKAHGAKNILVVGTRAQAKQMLDSGPFAAAILDTHFGGTSTALLAEALANVGVPLVFLSADPVFTIEPALTRAIILPKPHAESELVKALADLLDLSLS